MGEQSGNENLVDKYQQYSHESLYNWLKEGDPTQVSGLTTKWHQIVEGLHDLHINLDKELKTIDGRWTSGSGDEFQRRMGLVSEFSCRLAEDIGNYQVSIDDLNSELRDAQSKMENPEDTDDNDSAIKDGAIGALAGPFGALAGAYYGHKQDEQQKKDAKNRMVRLVAGLAGDYQPFGTGNPPDVPPDLPGEPVQGLEHMQEKVAPGSGTSAVPATNPMADRHDEHGDFDITAPQAPTTGSGTPPAGNGPGTPAR